MSHQHIPSPGESLEEILAQAALKRGSKGEFKHGLCHLQEYRAWQTMRLRCLNPENKAYPEYGGRGITVCPEWQDDFIAFLRHMGLKPTKAHELDRIKNDKGYEPGNCRWATRSQNDRNRRNNKWVEFRGEKRLLIELCEEFSIGADIARWRLKRGDTIEQALLSPVRKKVPNGQAVKITPWQTGYYLADGVRQQILDLRLTGMGAKKISKITGVSDTHIVRICKKAGIWESTKEQNEKKRRARD